MDENTKNSPCKECDDDVDEVQLHAEVVHLRQHLAQRDSHIEALESEFIKCNTRSSDLEEQLNTWREKYERLYDSHKRVQKLNQVLEDKLLQMVDKMKGEKSQLTKDIATLSVRLAESKHNYSMLQKENERYKNDMILAIQLLQCKPDNFVAQKLDNLPVDIQARVSQYVMSKTSKQQNSTQPKNGNNNEVDTFDASEYEFNISASLMSKILEDSIQDTVTKHCDTCTCNKSQNKPFCFNENYYSVSTQTNMTGEIENSLCFNCNVDKSINSNMSIKSSSPNAIKLIKEKATNHSLIGPMYIIPQPLIELHMASQPSAASVLDAAKSVSVFSNNIQNDDKNVINIQNNTILNDESVNQDRKSRSVDMEPAVHHKLCDRTKTSISSKKSCPQSVGQDDVFINKDSANLKEIQSKIDNKLGENSVIRKSSQSSMGALSRTSSVAKSTVSTHKSNIQVGPGPRFCHLRMQAGSKNILLDNAEPDVPPVLYRRQSKCNENSIFKDLNDDLENFIDLDKTDDDIKNDTKNANVVVESTLIDVHVDNNNKESSAVAENTAINPVLLNVSSSPLQPLKTHNFSNSSEHNNKSQSIGSLQNTIEVDNLLNDFSINVNSAQINEKLNAIDSKKKPISASTNDKIVKIFNFDRYEQGKLLNNQYNKSLRKIDMSQLHSLENTKISKDFPPQGDLPKIEKKIDPTKVVLSPMVNVYPNLTQTHLKVNENKKVFTNEHSTSSLSSDDSTALLQKQQLLRVAEWVEKNLEQQNNFNDPLDDDVNFSNRNMRRDLNISRLTETLNELALSMPHPVSKYSKAYAREGLSSRIPKCPITVNAEKTENSNIPKSAGNITKETLFPVESDDVTVTEISEKAKCTEVEDFDMSKELRDVLNTKRNKEITAEELARMEYNVKKFLLSGPHWVNPEPVERSRRTSSKTETDV